MPEMKLVYFETAEHVTPVAVVTDQILRPHLCRQNMTWITKTEPILMEIESLNWHFWSRHATTTRVRVMSDLSYSIF